MIIASCILISTCLIYLCCLLSRRRPRLHWDAVSRGWMQPTDRPIPLRDANESTTQPPSLASSRPQARRIVIAMTGATGAIIGIRLLERLRELGVETHLIISNWAAETIRYETSFSAKDVRALATKTYSSHDVSASISSGSFRTDAMIVVPCSMRTLSAIRTGFADDLICRAADVTLKEQRKLILVVRETPLSVIHLENMLGLARQRVVIFPPMPAFYNKPSSIDDVVDQTVGRMLDMLDIETSSFKRWTGFDR